MTPPLRVGTRRSPLARAQTASLVNALRRRGRTPRVEIVGLTTSGDRDRTPGASPDFTGSLNRAVLRGELDCAVHSAKDLPVELDAELAIVAVPRRADARDCLIASSRRIAAALPRGARIGSSSPRRRAQLLRWRPDLRVVEIRGNVDTRIGQVRSGAIDAAILAVAGVSRLGRAAEIDRVLSVSAFVPAPAQGALAVVARRSDPWVSAIVGPVDHRPSHAAVVAERAFAAALGGDCHLPLGALATVQPSGLSIVGEVVATDGRTSLRRRTRRRVAEAEEAGRSLGDALRSLGALELIDRDPRPAV